MKRILFTKGLCENRVFALIKEHKCGLIILSVLLVLNIFSVYSLKFDYNIGSDDMAYVEAGRILVESGKITCHGEYPSAQIMPGMPLILGALIFCFGEGKAFWISLKLLWVVMGVLTAWLVYLSTYLYAPKWSACLAMLPFARADIIWMNNIPLTETPFIFCFAGFVYFTLKSGKNASWKSFVCGTIFFLLGLSIRASIAVAPVLSFIYLLIVRKDKKRIVRTAPLFLAVITVFLMPWTVRNYKVFNRFIPLTYGTGNPLLLGTYQGSGYPEDSELDYDTNVYEVIKVKYAEYMDEDGKVKPEYRNIMSLYTDKVMAEYRIEEWIKRDPSSFAYSFIVQKPVSMMKSVFLWDTVNDTKWSDIMPLQKIDLYIFVCAVVLSLILRKYRKAVLFVAGLYMFNVYMCSMAYSFSRYNASLMFMRFIIVGYFSALVAEAICRIVRNNGMASI